MVLAPVYCLSSSHAQSRGVLWGLFRAKYDATVGDFAWRPVVCHWWHRSGCPAESPGGGCPFLFYWFGRGSEDAVAMFAARS